MKWWVPRFVPYHPSCGGKGEQRRGSSEKAPLAIALMAGASAGLAVGTSAGLFSWWWSRNASRVNGHLGVSDVTGPIK